MFNLLRRLLGGNAEKPLTVEAYWCDSPIKLADKVETPAGSHISVVRVCVDIEYSVLRGNISLRGMKLSGGGSGIFGSDTSVNVASHRTGEAWFASRICSTSELEAAVRRDLSVTNSNLLRIMMGKWRALDH